MNIWKKITHPCMTRKQDELIQVFNDYLEIIRSYSWTNHEQLIQALELHQLKHIHFKMVTGEILPHRKPNNKADSDPKAWRPIMCLCGASVSLEKYLQKL